MSMLQKVRKGLRGLFTRVIENTPFLSGNYKNRYPGAVVVNNVDVRTVVRESQDITKWRNALIQAENSRQDRVRLYDLYEDVMLDGVLISTVEKRIGKVSNLRYVFRRSDGEVVEEVTRMAQKTYWEEMMKGIMESKFYGHSLLELNWPTPNSDPRGRYYSKVVPRKHVKPRWGVVVKNTWDSEGIDYRSRPIADNLIEVGGDEDLGRLLQAAQYVIYKRGGFGDWAEFAETFGMPFRWATYNNPESREILTNALETAGSAGYVVAPNDANLNYIQAHSGAGNDVYRFLRDACNQEIAITILGNSMTTLDTKNSGYAQGVVHQDSEDDIVMTDRRFALRMLNERLTPYLELLGWPVSDGQWHIEEEDRLSLAQRIDIDLKLNSVIAIPESYWYNKYGVPVPTEDDPPPMEREEATPDPNEQEDDAED